MINVLSYIGMNLQSELCLWTLLGLLRTIFDATLFKVNANLKQVWQMNMPPELTLPVQRVLRTMISGVMLVQCFTVYVYLASYIVLLYPVFLEERPTLVLPWLLLAAIRKFLCELLSLALGLGTCVLLGPARPPCIRFLITKVASIMPAFYMWMLVFSYYNTLKMASAFKTFPAVLQSSDHDYGLELAVRRRRTKSLQDEEQLRKKIVAALNYGARHNAISETVISLNKTEISSRMAHATDTDAEDVKEEACGVRAPFATPERLLSNVGSYEDWCGSEVILPRDTDRILEQFVLMLLRISAFIKIEGTDPAKLFASASRSRLPYNNMDCTTLGEGTDTPLLVGSSKGKTASYLQEYPQIFMKKVSDVLQRTPEHKFGTTRTANNQIENTGGAVEDHTVMDSVTPEIKTFNENEKFTSQKQLSFSNSAEIKSKEEALAVSVIELDCQTEIQSDVNLIKPKQVGKQVVNPKQFSTTNVAESNSKEPNTRSECQKIVYKEIKTLSEETLATRGGQIINKKQDKTSNISEVKTNNFHVETTLEPECRTLAPTNNDTCSEVTSTMKDKKTFSQKQEGILNLSESKTKEPQIGAMLKEDRKILVLKEAETFPKLTFKIKSDEIINHNKDNTLNLAENEAAEHEPEASSECKTLALKGIETFTEIMPIAESSKNNKSELTTSAPTDVNKSIEIKPTVKEEKTIDEDQIISTNLADITIKGEQNTSAAQESDQKTLILRNIVTSTDPKPMMEGEKLVDQIQVHPSNLTEIETKRGPNTLAAQESESFILNIRNDETSNQVANPIMEGEKIISHKQVTTLKSAESKIKQEPYTVAVQESECRTLILMDVDTVPGFTMGKQIEYKDDPKSILPDEIDPKQMSLNAHKDNLQTSDIKKYQNTATSNGYKSSSDNEAHSSKEIKPGPLYFNDLDSKDINSNIDTREELKKKEDEINISSESVDSLKHIIRNMKPGEDFANDQLNYGRIEPQMTSYERYQIVMASNIALEFSDTITNIVEETKLSPVTSSHLKSIDIRSEILSDVGCHNNLPANDIKSESSDSIQSIIERMKDSLSQTIKSCREEKSTNEESSSTSCSKHVSRSRDLNDSRRSINDKNDFIPKKSKACQSNRSGNSRRK